jgi:4-hydroxy-tetrahydrodipicolinate synthase
MLDLSGIWVPLITPFNGYAVDCGGDADHTQAIINDGRLQMLAGDDQRIFATLCQGGVGAVAASAHLRPELFVAPHRHIRGNDLRGARALWQALWPLTRALFDEPNPAPVKAALAKRDDMPDELRAPMTRATPAGLQRVLCALQRVEEFAAAGSQHTARPSAT